MTSGREGLRAMVEARFAEADRERSEQLDRDLDLRRHRGRRARAPDAGSAKDARISVYLSDVRLRVAVRHQARERGVSVSALVEEALRRFLVLLALVAWSPALADDWTASDTAAEVAFVAVLALDMAQTATDIGPGCRETNPILGQCPTRSEVLAYGVASAAMHLAVARALPRPYRRIWQVVWVGVEAGYVTHNHMLGVRIRF